MINKMYLWKRLSSLRTPKQYET